MDTLQVSSLCCQVQRSAFLFICPLQVSTVGQQELDYGLMIIQSCEMQGSALLVAVRVDAGTSILDKNSCTLKIPVVGGMMQCCPSIGIHVIQICFAINNSVQGLFFSTLLKFGEYCLVNGSLAKDAHFVIYFVATVN